LENRKPNSAQDDPLSPTPCARPRCLTGGPRLSVPTSVPSLPLSLAAPWARSVDAVPLARAPASLSALPTPPVSSSSTSRPRSPHRGRAHDHVIPCHLRTSPPLLSPAPCSPTFPRSLVPTAEPSRPLSRSAHATRPFCYRLPTSAARSMVTVELPATSVALVSFALSPTTWNASRFAPKPSGSPGPHSPEHFLRSRSPTAVDPKLHRTFAVLQASQISHSR
jgi:hypothetical protein